MKKRYWLIAVFAAVLLVLAIVVLRPAEPCQGIEGPMLYFTVSDDVHTGPALGSEPYNGPDVTCTENLNPRLLISALLSGPSDEDLTSPFPKGVILESWKFDKKDPTNLKLKMSEQYNDLTDISLTLADYCIVLTVSQLPGVETVEITSGSYSTSYRSHQLLRADEVELEDPLAKTVPLS